MSEATVLQPPLRANYDKYIIIGAPLLAFLLIALTCKTRYQTNAFLVSPTTPQWLPLFAILLTYSHIFLVFLRSHLNKEVLKRHPFRFGSIPLFLMIALWSSPAIFGVASFIALYWDEWHSLMQTFGFGRIYDAKKGSDPIIGRKLDMGMSFVVGLLPHVILLTFIPEVQREEGFLIFLDIEKSLTAQYGHYLSNLKYPLISFGIGYTAFYIMSYRRLIKNGYQYSPEKFYLFLSTGIAAILIASLYSVKEAAFFGNIYHALQYYLIVYRSEGKNLPRVFGRNSSESKKSIMLLCFGLFMVVAFFLAYARSTTTKDSFGFLGALWLSTALLHFWYDGFIWSVRRQDV